MAPKASLAPARCTVEGSSNLIELADTPRNSIAPQTFSERLSPKLLETMIASAIRAQLAVAPPSTLAAPRNIEVPNTAEEEASTQVLPGRPFREPGLPLQPSKCPNPVLASLECLQFKTFKGVSLEK
ncbi:UNVERIFIED_CONTAM: hypothetical protein Sradi_3200000 [Sesamum radiatum]|uniref:Uncharacterized protein n=1 Tax=Sesamum radiatum TaxID=300843 RepID=A0AAW2RF33_SESRA